MQRLPRSDAKYQITKPPPGMKESAVAAATRNSIARAGLIGSTFEGAEDHDGTKFAGLTSPAPLDAELSSQQWEEMTRRVMEIGGPVRRGFVGAVGRDEWVLVLVEIDPTQAVSDPRVVGGVLAYLLERDRGRRFTIAAALPPGASGSDAWESDWDGQFGGLTYRSMLDGLRKRHPDVRLELTDLTAAGAIPMHVRGRPLAAGLPDGMISVAKPFQQCDSVICVAPLTTHPEMGVGLCFGLYPNVAAAAEYGPGVEKLRQFGSSAECAVDLFAFRPADIVVLGGAWAGEGNGSRLRHNLVAAGTGAVAVEAITAATMGFAPEELEQLHLASRKGFNSEDVDGLIYYTWLRGHEIDDVKRDFQRPAGWKPYAPAD